MIGEEDTMTIMPPELVQAVKEAGGAPVRLTDPQTNETYVILREAVYRQVTSLLGNADEMYPLLAKLSPDDWEDGSVYGITPKAQ
jgi:hypothetical protein